MKDNIKNKQEKVGCGWIDCLKIGYTSIKTIMNLRISEKKGLYVFQELRQLLMD